MTGQAAGFWPAHGFPPAPTWTKEQEIEEYRVNAQSIKEALENINRRLQELEREE